MHNKFTESLAIPSNENRKENALSVHQDKAPLADHRQRIRERIHDHRSVPLQEIPVNHREKGKNMKKNTPIITHTEILCLAIRCLQKEINDMTAYLEGIESKEEYLTFFLAERTPKLDAMKELYRIETGSEYVE
jgi:hypothetical protein